MTPRETSALRDKVARARLGIEEPAATVSEPLVPDARSIEIVPNAAIREPRYPVTGRVSIIECPVHQLVVALNAEGRICSTCPGCMAEVEAVAA